MNDSGIISNPLVVRCENCGGTTVYDIEQEKYRCKSCGALFDYSTIKTNTEHWKDIHKITIGKEANKIKIFKCKSCGAKVTSRIIGSNTAECPFCRSVLKESSSVMNIPDIIIPFEISKDRAIEQIENWYKTQMWLNAARQIFNKRTLLNWYKTHMWLKTAKQIFNQRTLLQGCYLPYYVTRGIIKAETIAAWGAADEKYELFDNEYTIDSPDHQMFRTFLNEIAVNASQDLDNNCLDAAEPFDFSRAQGFEFKYLAGERAKIHNINASETEKRITAETKNKLWFDLKKRMGTSNFRIKINEIEAESFTAFLPMYILKFDGKTVAVNGQTGKVAISTNQKIKFIDTYKIVVFAILTIIGVCSISCFFESSDNKLLFSILFIIIIVAFVNNETKDIDEVLTYSGNLKNENSSDLDTLFYSIHDGKETPVVIKYYGLWQTIRLILGSLITIFAPFITAYFAIMAGHGNRLLFSEGKWYYGVAAIVSAIYCLRQIPRRYTQPFVHKINTDGKPEKMSPIKFLYRQLLKQNIDLLLTNDSHNKAGGYAIFMLLAMLFAFSLLKILGIN